METKKAEFPTLSPLEVEMMRANIDGTFFPPEQTEEECAAMLSVIDKADAYMEALQAYDELDDSLMKWFLAKYEEQQADNNA